MHCLYYCEQYIYYHFNELFDFNEGCEEECSSFFIRLLLVLLTVILVTTHNISTKISVADIYFCLF